VGFCFAVGGGDTLGGGPLISGAGPISVHEPISSNANINAVFAANRAMRLTPFDMAQIMLQCLFARNRHPAGASTSTAMRIGDQWNEADWPKIFRF
jgi:hypothetical protein